jgi:exopolysaccharide biosynthesis protein
LFDLRVAVAPKNRSGGQIATDFITRPNAVLSLNGGFFDIDRNADANNILIPSGLLISDSHQVSSAKEKAGSGVIFTTISNIGILHLEQFNIKDAVNAVQAGPILVEDGGKSGIYKNDFNRQNRTAICLQPRHAIFIIVEGGVSLFELAQLSSSAQDIGGFGCSVAINLDGGPSTQAVFRSGGKNIAISGR